MTGQVGADTSLLIDFFNGEGRAVSFMREYASALVVSELVVYEFLCGNLTEKEQTHFLGAMKSFPSARIDREAVLVASRIFRAGKKSGRSIGHQDALIAASYLAAGVVRIATRNPKHCSGIKGLTVLEYAGS